MSFKQAPIKNYRIKNLGQKLSKLDAFFTNNIFIGSTKQKSMKNQGKAK